MRPLPASCLPEKITEHQMFTFRKSEIDSGTGVMMAEGERDENVNNKKVSHNVNERDFKNSWLSRSFVVRVPSLLCDQVGWTGVKTEQQT